MAGFKKLNSAINILLILKNKLWDMFYVRLNSFSILKNNLKA